MELILWRHAEAEPAEPGTPDHDRKLTVKGHKQATKMAEWLDRNLPSTCKILASPAMRALQTAQALGRKFKIHPGLAPGAEAQDLLTIVHWPHSREPVLVVGHQPTLGRAAALLISGAAQDWTIRKSNVLWVAQREHGDAAANFLRAVVSPDLVGK